MPFPSTPLSSSPCDATLASVARNTHVLERAKQISRALIASLAATVAATPENLAVMQANVKTISYEAMRLAVAEDAAALQAEVPIPALV